MSNLPFTEANFEEIFKKYFGPLCNYVNSYIKDWESSREIVQATFLKIWENRAKIEVKTSIQNYLYSSVRNKMIDHIRSRDKREEVKGMIEQGEIKDNPDNFNSFLIRQEIMKSLDKLKPKMRKIFSLSKIEGLTYGEISSYLNISKRAVEDNVARALKILKEDLKDNEIIFTHY